MPSTTSNLTAEQKLATIETSEMPVAWDGCHKIYLCRNDAEEAAARNTGYPIYPSANIRQMIEDSCSLVFVSYWGMGNDDWKGELTFEQFDRDLWMIFWPESVEEADAENSNDENDEEN